MAKAILIILGAVFAAAAVPFLIRGFRELAVVKGGEIIKARIAELKTQQVRNKHNGRTIIYMPVYEYYENGERKLFENGVYTSSHKEVSDEVTLYKGKNGKCERIVENRNTAMFVSFGIMFSISAICCFCGVPTIE